MSHNISCWRAVGRTKYGAEHLLYLGNTMEQVKKNYPGSFYEILTTKEQSSINEITLERWTGKPNCGRWVEHDDLKIPRIYNRKHEA